MKNTRRVLLTITLTLFLAGEATAGLREARRVSERVGLPTEHAVAYAALEGVGEAEGWGRIVVRDDDLPNDVHRTITVWLYGLTPFTPYTVQVDGVALGTVITRVNGDALLRLQNRGNGHGEVPEDLPPAAELLQATVVDDAMSPVLEGSFTVASKGPGSTVYEEQITLEDVTGGEATGAAKVEIRSDGHQEFTTHAAGLVPGATMTVRVTLLDGTTVEVATVVVDDVGQAMVKLESPSDDHPLPPELDPVSDIRLVEWLDEGGAVILSGTFTGVNQSDEVTLAGTFVELTADGFVLETADGQVTVIVTDETMFKGFASLDELAAGDQLEVEGFETDAGVVATKVELMPGDEDELVLLKGTFVEPTADGFTLETVDGVVAVIVTPETRFMGFSSLDELVAGDSLKVHVVPGDELVAVKVKLEQNKGKH